MSNKYGIAVLKAALLSLEKRTIQCVIDEAVACASKPDVSEFERDAITKAMQRCWRKAVMRERIATQIVVLETGSEEQATVQGAEAPKTRGNVQPEPVLVASFKAYNVYDLRQHVMSVSRRQADSLEFAMEYKSRSHGIQYKMFKLSSVAAYAAQYNEDEAEAVARAKSFGHELYFMVPLGCSLTSQKRSHANKYLVKPNQLISFDGQLLRVEPASNKNIKLVPIGEAA
ncbi:TPA: hypothetical protein ACSTLU_004423 [Serratia fonticola]